MKYPELTRATITSTAMHISRERSPGFYTSLSPDQLKVVWEQDFVPAVNVTMPVDDWNRIIEIYQAHYDAANQNPAVIDRWLEYRMMVALTET